MIRLFHPRISIRLLLAVTALIAIAMGVPRSIYLHDRAVVDSIGPAVYFAHVDDSIAWLAGPPHAIGFYRWHGPRLLESPMRSMGVPWFDRIERVRIYVDEKMSLETLGALPRLTALRSIEIENPTLDVNQYRNAIVASGRSVALDVQHY